MYQPLASHSGAPAKRVSVDDSESAAVPVSRKRSDRLTGEFVLTGLTTDDEQPIAPRRRKYSWVVTAALRFAQVDDPIARLPRSHGYTQVPVSRVDRFH